MESATITLEDNDTADTVINLTASDTTIVEDETMATTITVTATLTGSVSRDVPTVVNLANMLSGTADGGGTDYTLGGSLPASITIPAESLSGDAATTFTIDPEDDGVSEGPEYIELTGSATGFTVNKMRIELEDDDLPVINLSLTDMSDAALSSLAETADSTTVKVTATRADLSLDSAEAEVDVTVGVTTGTPRSTADRGADYTGDTTFTITIPEDELSASETFSINPLDDLIQETGGETVIIGGEVDGGGRFFVAPATLTIADDDSTDYDTDGDRLIEISSAAQLHAMRWDPSGEVNVSAANHANYVAAFPGAFTAMCDDPNTNPTVEDCEGYELTADIDLASFNTGAGWEPIPNWSATFDGDGHTITGLTIRRSSGNDVGLFGLVAAGGVVEDLAVTGASVTGGSRVGVVAGSNSGTIRRVYAAGTVTVHTTTGGGVVGQLRVGGSLIQSAAAVNVSTASASVFRIGGLAAQSAGTVSDSFAEGTVTAGADNRGAGGLVGDARAAITNSYARGAVRPRPGGSSTGGLVGLVNAGTAPGSYWDTQTSGHTASALGTGLGTLEMQAPTAAGSASGDTYHGWDGTNTWDFGNAGQYPVLKGLPLTPAQQRGETVTLTVTSGGSTLSTLAEEAGETSVVVTATLNGGATAPVGGTTVVLSLEGTAVHGESSGNDYSHTVPASITIPAGSSSVSTTNATITPVSDMLWEPAKTIIVRGTNAAPAVITLTSEDDPAVTLSSTTATIVENAGATSVTVKAVLQEALTTAGTLTLTFSGTATEGSGNDYTASPKTITIPANTLEVSQAITITPANNTTRNGDKTITIGGTLSGYQVGSFDITLDDDEPIPITLTVDADSVTPLDQTSIGEEAGAKTVKVTATLTEGALGDATIVSVDDVITGAGAGTATSGTDYTAITAKNLTILAGATTGSVDFTVTPDNDVINEGDETIVFGGTLSGFKVAPATLTITDNDGTSDKVNITVDTVKDVEGGPTTIGNQTAIGEEDGETTVTIRAAVNKGASTSAITVNLSYSGDGTAGEPGDGDYTSDPMSLGTITIPANETFVTTTVKITPVNDTVYEGDETIIIGGTTTASGITAVNSATLTIEEDDTAPTEISLSVTPVSVNESDAGTAQTITVSASLEGSVTRDEATVVTLNTTLAGTATVGTGNDYTHTAFSAATITIPAKASASSANVTFTVTPGSDSTAEGTETIIVRGSACQTDDSPCPMADQFTVNAASIDLIDDDLPNIALSVTPSSTTEASGTTSVEVPVVVTATRDTSEHNNSGAVRVNVTIGTSASSATRGTGAGSTWPRTRRATRRRPPAPAGS